MERSSLPYAVMLSVMLAFAALDMYGIAHALHYMAAFQHGDQLQSQWYHLIGSNVAMLIVAAAFSLAATQWLVERWRMGRLPGYAPVCVALLAVVLRVAWDFARVYGIDSLLQASSLPQQETMIVVSGLSVVLDFVLLPALMVFSVWLVFRLLRGGGVPMAHADASRGLALLVFTLFAWAWVVAALSMLLPSLLYASLASGVDAGQWLAAPPMQAIPFFASFGFVLPMCIGGLLGLPKRMVAVRPWYLWLVATVCMVSSMVVMAALVALVAFLALAWREGGAGVLALGAGVTVAWFVSCVLLCRGLVRLMTRRLGVPIVGGS